jgi:hypothetical protein
MDYHGRYSGCWCPRRSSYLHLSFDSRRKIEPRARFLSKAGRSKKVRPAVMGGQQETAIVEAVMSKAERKASLSKPKRHTFVQSVRIFELWDREQDQPTRKAVRVRDPHGEQSSQNTYTSQTQCADKAINSIPYLKQRKSACAMAYSMPWTCLTHAFVLTNCSKTHL